MKTWTLKQMGELAQNYRTRMKLTKKQLAEQAGVSVYSVTKLEKGNASIGIEEVIKICKILNLSTDFLLTGELGLPEVIDLNQRMLHFEDINVENLRKIALSFWETCPEKK